MLGAMGAGVTLGGLSASATKAAAQSRPASLVVSTFGGDYGNNLKEQVDEAFTAQYGIDVVHDVGDNAARIAKIKFNLQNGSYDLVNFADAFFSRAEEQKILDKMNYDSKNLTNVANVDPSFRYDTWVPTQFSSYGIAYNPDMVEKPPVSWLDLWDPKYKGKVLFPNISYSYGIYIFFLGAIAAGKDWKDINAGAAMLKKFTTQQPIWGVEDPDVVHALQTKQVALGPFLKANWVNLHENGSKLQFVSPKEGGVFVSWGFGIVKDSKNRDWSEKYINIALSPQVQAATAGKRKVIGSNKDWTKYLDKKEADLINLSGAEMKNLITFDQKWINAHRTDLTNTWNSIVS